MRRLAMIKLGRVLRERRHRQNRLAGIVNRLCGEGADGAGGKRNHSDSENKHAGLLSIVGVRPV